jgi:hypothetical protein
MRIDNVSAFRLDVKAFSVVRGDMGWFKHYTNMHENEGIIELMDRLGHAGGLCYYILLEMCVGQLKGNKKNLTESDMVFRFHERILRERLRLSPKKLREFLKISSENFGFFYEFSENFLKIEMPKLLKLLHRVRKKGQSKDNRVTTEGQTKSNRVTTKEKKTEVTDEKRLSEKEAASQNKRIKEAYIAAYRERYGVEPLTQNAMFNTQCNNLRKKVGVDTAIELVKFYLKHPKAFYVSKTHSFGLLVADAETLVAQMRMGVAVTGIESRQIEQNAAIMAQYERAGRE